MATLGPADRDFLSAVSDLVFRNPFDDAMAVPALPDLPAPRRTWPTRWPSRGASGSIAAPRDATS